MSNSNKQITAELRIKTILDEAQRDFETFQKSVKGLWENQEPPKSVLKQLEKLRLELTAMQQIGDKDRVNIIDANQLESDYKKFNKVMRDMGIEFQSYTKAQKEAMLDPQVATQIDKRAEAVKKYNDVLKRSVEIENKRKPLEQDITKNKSKITSKEAEKGFYIQKKANLEQNKPVETSAIKQYNADLIKQQSLYEKLISLEGRIQTEREKGTSDDANANNNLTRQIALQKEYEQQLAEVEASLASNKNAYDAYETQLNDVNNKIAEEDKKIEACNIAIQDAEDANKGLQKQLDKLPLPDTKEAFDQLISTLKALGVEGIDNTTTVDELEEKLKTLSNEALAQVQTRLDGATGDWRNLGNTMNQAGTQIEETNVDLQQQNTLLANQQAFASRIKQFLGLEGAVNIARSAFRNAFNTIKELDAAMTEMAVVTDLDVGDYWKQLPQHTKDANKLGVAIKDVYEAETLYYQQGLKQNEVVAMSTQTLKMARIAGLSAEDATNKMTAALRGFNMELNETSAQRVADVYSELAAITASDVDEISSAMSKTASIASNAGMEFETTAAFLSQIIETTRESAETAGTALKTVIARFQELKKSPSEIGEVDGEVVDANKIETALREVGVALRDTNGQFRNLDDVFLELSSKWADLDTNTQRYVATIAAGSRQQSRFIAMMSDYSRTQELVTAANASAGASNAQFEKTMESLETKLNNLKSAWDSFTMSIMNSNVIKKGVDILTTLLTTINKISDSLGNFSGVAKIGMLISALHLGEKALNVFNTSLKAQKGIWGSLGQVGKSALTGIHTKLVSLTKTIKSAFGQKSIFTGLSGNEIKKTTNSLDNYTNAVKHNSIAKEKMNELARQGKTGTEQYAYAQKLAAVSAEQQADAEASLSKALGLTTPQIVTASAMTEMGVGADQAMILSKAGITTQNLLAAASFDKEKISTVSNTLAKKLENAGTLRLLSTKIGLTVANWAHNASQKAEEGSTWAIITAKIAEIAVNWGLNASMAPLLIVTAALVLAIGALIGVVVLIVKAFKNWKANQPEAQLAALEEKTQQSKEAAKEAKEAYDELKTAVEGYESLLKTVDSLTEGTTAWKQAVSDLNENVMELITNFPKLAKFAKFENGMWVLDQQSLDDYNEKEEQRVANTDAAQHLINIEQSGLRKNINTFKQKAVSETKFYDSTGKEVSDEQVDYIRKEMLHGNYRVLQDMEVTALTSYENVLDYAVGKDNLEALNNLASLAEGGKKDDYTKAYNTLLTSLETDEQKEELKKFDSVAQILLDINKDTKNEKAFTFQKLGVSSQKDNPLFSAIANSLVGSYDYIVQRVEDEQDVWKVGTYWQNKAGKKTNEALTALLQQNNIEVSNKESTDLARYLEFLGGERVTDEQIKEWGDSANSNLAKKIQDQLAINALDSSLDTLYNTVTTEGSLWNDLYGTDAIDINVEEWITKLGRTNGLDAVTKTALQGQIDNIKQQQEDLTLEMEKIFGEDQVHLTPSQKRTLSQAYKVMENSFNETVAKSFATTLANTPELINTWSEQYSNVAWDDAIAGAAAIKQMQDSGNQDLMNIAQSILDNSEDKYSTIAQLQSFYKSMTVETLDDLMKDGEITGEEILELAKDNKVLATMLDTTGESASAVADYFMDIASGVITADQATKEYYENLKKENFLKYIQEDFDLKVAGLQFGSSSTEKFGKMNEFRTSAIDLYERGAYNDPVLWQYIRTMFDETTVQKEIEKQGTKKAATYFINKMKQMTNSYNAWKSLGIEGVSIGADGALRFDMDALGGQEGLIKALKDQGLAEIFIDALIAEAGGFTTGDTTFNAGGGIVETFAEKASQIYGLEEQEQEIYESAYDWLFILNQDVEDAVRQREKLEKKYSRLLKQEGSTAKESYEVYKEMLDSLETEITNKGNLKTEALNQIKKLYKTEIEGTGLEQYVIFDEATGKSTLKPKYYTDNLDDEERKKFDDTLTKLFDLENIIKDAEDAIEDATDAIEQEKEEQDKAITDALDKIKEGIIKERQEQIDQLSKINDTVKEAQDSLINKIQQQIDEDRQARENEKAQKDITDKETRLAYLMRDSSGANAMEIAQLQKEITEAKQDYSDTLVDQSIQKLSDSSEEAAEQRERQIELMQEQLDIYQEGVDIWRDAVAILFQGVNDSAWGEWLYENTWMNSEAARYIKLAEGYETMNPNSKEEFKNSIYASLGLLWEAYKNGDFNDILGRRYATGGLADFTGPAWLDGTKSHPELVLNAQDTRNFIQLKDILSDIMNSTPEKTGSSGDNYFDIDIQVESIQDDYDVEQLAEKIKGIIYEDSIYRNVNSINNIR